MIFGDNFFSRQSLGQLAIQFCLVSTIAGLTLALNSYQEVSAGGITGLVLLATSASIGIFAGARLLIVLANLAIEKASKSLPNKLASNALRLVLILAAAAMVMIFPGCFIYLLSLLLPAYVHFAGWESAITNGLLFMVADTVLSGMTGISLLFGKRDIKQATLNID